MSAVRRADVMIMAGGTGGHIFPGLAVAEALMEAGYSVAWLGARRGLEARLLAGRPWPLDLLDISGLRGRGMAGWLAMPVRLLRAVNRARRLLRQRGTRCAISFGGYAAGPGALAARVLGIPVIVHEQNRIPGLTNRVLSRVARRVLQGFPDTFPAVRKPLTVGNPVRPDIAAIAPPSERLGQHQGPPRLLVMGGSQGAGALNEVVPAALVELDREVAVRHQTGAADATAVEQSYAPLRNAGRDVSVTPFIDDMAEALAWADIAICRSGALTVAELAAAGLGAVLVPFPAAVDDHQTRNAQYLVDAGGAILLPQTELNAARLAAELAPLLARPAMRLELAQAARQATHPDSARRVVDVVREVLQT